MTAKNFQTALAGFVFLAAIVSLAAQATSLETQLVDAMNKLFGVHSGFRANHAKGLVVTGSFEATQQAAHLSKAVLFSGAKIPVTVTVLGCNRHSQNSGRLGSREPPWHSDQIPFAGWIRNRHGP